MKEKKPFFQCDVCFTKIRGSKRNLDRHIATIHDKTVVFKCDLCSKEFSQKVTLNVHISTVHEGKKPFHCEFCDNKFSTKFHMTRHISIVHLKVLFL